ncbi:unnamed protein product, partial [Amoebophrya sp. A25]|eukprot:GSA25T00020800001.1
MIRYEYSADNGPGLADASSASCVSGHSTFMVAPEAATMRSSICSSSISNAGCTTRASSDNEKRLSLIDVRPHRVWQWRTISAWVAVLLVALYYAIWGGGGGTPDELTEGERTSKANSSTTDHSSSTASTTKPTLADGILSASSSPSSTATDNAAAAGEQMFFLSTPHNTMFLGARQHLMLLCVLGLLGTASRNTLILQDRLVLYLGPLPVCFMLTRIPWSAIRTVSVSKTYQARGGGGEPTSDEFGSSGESCRSRKKYQHKGSCFYRCWLYSGSFRALIAGLLLPFFTCCGKTQAFTDFVVRISSAVWDACQDARLLPGCGLVYHVVERGIWRCKSMFWRTKNICSDTKQEYPYLVLLVNVSQLERLQTKERKDWQNALERKEGAIAGVEPPTTGIEMQAQPSAGDDEWQKAMMDEVDDGHDGTSFRRATTAPTALATTSNMFDVESGTPSNPHDQHFHDENDCFEEICVHLPDAVAVKDFIDKALYLDPACQFASWTEASDPWVPCDAGARESDHMQGTNYASSKSDSASSRKSAVAMAPTTFFGFAFASNNSKEMKARAIV